MAVTTISLRYSIYCKEELREDIELPALLIITFAINKLFKTITFTFITCKIIPTWQSYC